MITRYTDLEVNLNGLTFIVSGTYTPYEAATPHCPASEAEFDLDESRIKVKGQPEADPPTILEEMRNNLYIRKRPNETFIVDWTSGFEQLADECLRITADANGEH